MLLLESCACVVLLIERIGSVTAASHVGKRRC